MCGGPEKLTLMSGTSTDKGYCEDVYGQRFVNMENKDNREFSEENFHIKDLVKAENELRELRKSCDMEGKQNAWISWLDKIFQAGAKRLPVSIGKKKYCLTALFGGWLGLHQFMVGRKAFGILYLMLSFTGLSFVMSVMDLLYAAFLKADESHMIEI